MEPPMEPGRFPAASVRQCIQSRVKIHGVEDTMPVLILTPVQLLMEDILNPPQEANNEVQPEVGVEEPDLNGGGMSMSTGSSSSMLTHESSEASFSDDESAAGAPEPMRAYWLRGILPHGTVRSQNLLFTNPRRPLHI